MQGSISGMERIGEMRAIGWVHMAGSQWDSLGTPVDLHGKESKFSVTQTCPNPLPFR